MKQGQKVDVNGRDAYANMFTTDEMLAMYMSLNTSRETANDFLRQFPAIRFTTNEEMEKIDDVKHVLKNTSSAMIKIEKTFKSLGMDLTELGLE